MECREAINKFVLPLLYRSANRDGKNVSKITTNRATFGLGLSGKEKQQLLRREDNTNNSDDIYAGGGADHLFYSVVFGAPSSYALSSVAAPSFFPHLDAIMSSHTHRKLFPGNVIQVECTPGDVALPPWFLSSSSEEAEGPGVEKKIAMLRTISSKAKNNLKKKKGNNNTAMLCLNLQDVNMAALAVDPSPLYELMGFERPLSARRVHSSAAALLGDEAQQQQTRLGDGGGISGRSIQNTSLAAAVGGNSSLSSDPSTVLALPAHGNYKHLSELAPSVAKNLSLADYRRSFYTLGSDSVFSLGDVPRPIRFWAADFIVQQPQQRTLDGSSSSGSSSFLLSEEEVWYNAIQCSKRALEASSSLLNKDATVVLSLLRRRQHSVRSQRGGGNVVHDMFEKKTWKRSDHFTPSSSRSSSSEEDGEFLNFISGVRGVFGRAEVVPLKGTLPTPVGDGHGMEEEGSMHQRQQQQHHQSSLFERVLVVASHSASAIGSRRPTLNVLPFQDERIRGELVGGGNASRLKIYQQQKEIQRDERLLKNKTLNNIQNSNIDRKKADEIRKSRAALEEKKRNRVLWRPQKKQLGNKFARQARHDVRTLVSSGGVAGVGIGGGTSFIDRTAAAHRRKVAQQRELFDDKRRKENEKVRDAVQGADGGGGGGVDYKLPDD